MILMIRRKRPVAAIREEVHLRRPYSKQPIDGQRDVEVLGNRLGHRRWKGISNLAIGGRFATVKLPMVWKALNPGDHAGRQARHADEISRRGLAVSI
jgi:hypothetical protein